MSTPHELNGEIESHSCPKSGGIKVVITVPYTLYAEAAIYAMRKGGSVRLMELQRPLPDGEDEPKPEDPNQTTLDDIDGEPEVETTETEDSADEDGEPVGVGTDEEGGK